tara:strand:+ start:316 stop:909 length:594 start_codon:yes stop_codon:yes gene_type:complete
MTNFKIKNLYEVKKISYQDTKPFILDIHYAKRMPSISYAYGLFLNNELVGIISYGSPASPSLCKGIAGEKNKKLVIELNRLVLKNNKKNEASILIGASFKLLPKPKIIVSYADTAQDHLGVVYQATNFLFTGTSKPRTDMAGKDGKHSRHHLGDRTKRVYRSAKHRYVYLLGNKRQKRQLKEELRYGIMDYPRKNIE